jgi:hypothetical protein
MTDDMLMHRIRAHRSAPDVYDPPTFEDMAQRIEALQAAAPDYKLDPDLPAQLERLAMRAETSKTYVQEFRMMRAEGVADIIYEALAEIRHHRGIEE